MATVIRKIKCPKHFALKPGCAPFEMVPNPLLKRVSERAVREWKLRTMVPKRDKYGNKTYDRKNYYQPFVSAAWAVEHCWDPLNPICKLQCKGLCLEGLAVKERSIKRLTV
jgi:hypothetical protein